MVQVTCNVSELWRVTAVKVLTWESVSLLSFVLLNNPDFWTAVWVAEAVNVCRIVVEFVPFVCDLVVASALARPPVVISAVKAVSVAAGDAVLVVNAI